MDDKRAIVRIPPAGMEYDPRMGVPHITAGYSQHPGHPGETCYRFTQPVKSSTKERRDG